MTRREEALAELLGSLFSTEELRRALRVEHDLRWVLPVLPPGPKGAVFATAATLLTENGQVSPAFFQVLREARPKRQADIDALAARWARETALVPVPPVASPGRAPEPRRVVDPPRPLGLPGPTLGARLALPSGLRFHWGSALVGLVLGVLVGLWLAG